jgi:hypothetical protein
MRVIVEECKSIDLQAGDLFTDLSQEEWDAMLANPKDQRRQYPIAVRNEKSADLVRNPQDATSIMYRIVSIEKREPDI